MNELIKQRQELAHNIHAFLDSEFNDIRMAAENMAECATNLHGQGYASFMLSREDFFSKLRAIQDHVHSIGA